MSTAPAGASPDRRHRVAVLLSGRGSNFLALHEAAARGRLPAEIALVVCNEPTAPGLERARELGLPTALLPHRGEPSRAAHEEKVLAELHAAGAEWICLAGYMRLLSASFVGAWRERILNIHPSLLPLYRGLHPQRQALAAGAKESGCTVHFVDEGLDSGPIVLQRRVPVLPDDDERSLAARILEQEHRAYPEALARLLSEAWHVEDSRVVFGS